MDATELVAKYRKARSSFGMQQHHAKERGIEWKLTFEEWFSWWQETGHYEERGRKKGQYCMARFNDIGPYALDNIKCIQHRENAAEGQRGTAKWNSGIKCTPEQRAKMGYDNRGPAWNKGVTGYHIHSEEEKQKRKERMQGNQYAKGSAGWKHSEETLAKMKGHVVSEETRRKISETKRQKALEKAVHANGLFRKRT